jgi:hypothetical protein
VLTSRLLDAKTAHLHQIQNDRMMHDAVNRCNRSERVFEDALPLREDQIGRQTDAALLVAVTQQGKKHLHFILVMLYIADVIQDQAGIAMQLHQFLRQAQIAFGGKPPLHELRRGGPQHGVALLHQVMRHRSEKVTFTPSIEMPS